MVTQEGGGFANGTRENISCIGYLFCPQKLAIIIVAAGPVKLVRACIHEIRTSTFRIFFGWYNDWQKRKEASLQEDNQPLPLRSECNVGRQLLPLRFFSYEVLFDI